MARPKAELALTQEEQAQLQSMAYSDFSSSAMKFRANLILACASGIANSEVAIRFKVTELTVGKWRRRFIAKRLNGLNDKRRTGRPRATDNGKVIELISKALRDPPADGKKYWTISSVAAKTGISKTSVWRYFVKFGIYHHQGKAATKTAISKQYATHNNAAMIDETATEQRSRMMRAVKSQNTSPERQIRKLVSSMGYRYRLHRSDLPGKPDLVFANIRKIIFVHGCFWHGHNCQRGSRMPKSNSDYWRAKIDRNIARDKNTIAQLKANGWEILLVWECQLQNGKQTVTRLRRFLG